MWQSWFNQGKRTTLEGYACHIPMNICLYIHTHIKINIHGDLASCTVANAAVFAPKLELEVCRAGRSQGRMEMKQRRATSRNHEQ